MKGTDEAIRYIQSLDLSGTPRGITHLDAASDATAVFDQAKQQAQVVGSGVFSFVQGVEAQTREAISDCALLAQLVANKRSPVEQSLQRWFDTYIEVLQNVGWNFQDRGWSDYSSYGHAAEVNEHILEVLKVALGPSPAALAIVTATMGAMKKMQGGGSWLTLFNRESQKASIARFQIGLAEPDPADTKGVLVSLMCCLIEAQSNITQVLFFKFRSANASFSARSERISLNTHSLVDLGPAVRTKVRAYQADYLSSIVDI